MATGFSQPEPTRTRCTDGMETPTLDTVGHMDASHTQHQQVHAAPALSLAQVVP